MVDDDDDDDDDDESDDDDVNKDDVNKDDDGGDDDVIAITMITMISDDTPIAADSKNRYFKIMISFYHCTSRYVYLQ